jgi:hypothetical protein
MGWLPGGRLAALRVGIRRAEPPDHLHVPGVGFVEGADQFREINWAGDSLFLWLWSDEAIAPADLPRIALIDLDRGHTSQMPLGAFTTELKGSVGYACGCHWHASRAPR